MPLHAYANYAMGAPQVGFSFRAEPSTVFYMFGSVLVHTFCFQVPDWMLYSPLGAQVLGFAPFKPFGVFPWQAYVQPGNGHWPTPCMQSGCFFCYFE